MDDARTRHYRPEKDLRLTFPYLGRCQFAEYSKQIGNVGEPGWACPAGRIPEEGAQRPMSLGRLLGAVLFLDSHKIALDKDVEGNSFSI